MAKKIIKAQMKQRRDTKANWAATNPVLLDGELGIVSDDPNLYKIGDGSTAWNSLPFRGFDGTLAQELGTSPNAAISQKVVSEKLTELKSYTINAGYFTGEKMRGYYSTSNTPIQVSAASSIQRGESCVPGEVFLYTGYAGANAFLARFFKNGVFVSGASVATYGLLEDYRITIPAEVDYAIFQSVCFDSMVESDGFRFSIKRADARVDELSEKLGFSQIEGFLRRDGNKSGLSVAKSTLLQKYCIPGETYQYSGWYGGDAVAALFYHNDEIIGAVTKNEFDFSKDIIITIPDNCNKVLFQSTQYNGVSEDVEFSVYLVQYNALKGNLSLNAKLGSGFLSKQDVFTNSSAFTNKTTPILNCKEGDVYYYRGWGMNEAVSYIMYLDGVQISYGQHSDISAFQKVVIPAGVNQIKFSSTIDKDKTISDVLIFDLYHGEDVDSLIKIVGGDSGSILLGKSINWLGDSYVANHTQATSLTWHYLIASKYMMDYRNYGKNGTRIVGGASDCMDVRWKNMEKDADYVMVVGGTNDFNSQTPIATFKAQLKSFLQELITDYPTSRIAVWTPFNDNGELDPYHGYTDVKILLGEYAQAMEEVCQSIGLACFNSFNKANIYAWSEAFRTLYFQSPTDMAHLNAEGHKRFMTMAESFLLSL